MDEKTTKQYRDVLDKTLIKQEYNLHKITRNISFWLLSFTILYNKFIYSSPLFYLIITSFFVSFILNLAYIYYENKTIEKLISFIDNNDLTNDKVNEIKLFKLWKDNHDEIEVTKNISLITFLFGFILLIISFL